MGTQEELDKLIEDFLKIAYISGVSLSQHKIITEILTAPHHRPAGLSAGKKAIYVFLIEEHCLKVGKAGPRSVARFASHHYNTKSSGSNLARSVLKSRDLLKSVLPSMQSEIDQLSERNIGSWLENNTTRCHFFIDSEVDDLVLSLFEIFLQCRLKPLFEGKTRI